MQNVTPIRRITSFGRSIAFYVEGLGFAID